MSASDEKFAAWLRKARADAGLSQAAVGDVIAGTQTTVSKIESGKRPVSLAEAAVIAELFGTTLDTALGLRPATPTTDRAELHRVRRLLAHIHDAIGQEIAREAAA